MIQRYTVLMARGKNQWRGGLPAACLAVCLAVCLAMMFLGCGGHRFHRRDASCDTKNAVVDTGYWTPELQKGIHAELAQSKTALPDGFADRVLEKMNRVVSVYAESQRAMCEHTFATPPQETSASDEIQLCLSMPMTTHQLLATHLISDEFEHPERVEWLIEGMLLGIEACRYESEYGFYADAAPDAATKNELAKARRQWAKLTVDAAFKNKTRTVKKLQTKNWTQSHGALLYVRFLIALQQALAEFSAAQYEEAKSTTAIVRQLADESGNQLLNVHAMSMTAMVAIYDKDFSEYKKINMQALQTYLSITGDSPTATRNPSNFRMLGGLAESAGDYWRALEAREAAISHYRQLLGDDSILLAWEYFWIGNCYRELDRHEAAAQAYDNALERMKRLLGPENPTLGFVYDTLSDAYSETNTPERSAVLREKALRIEIKNANEPNESQVNRCIRLAEDYRDHSNPAKALEMYELALSLRTQLLGARDLGTATIYFEIGRVHTDMIDYDNAYGMFKQALELQKELSGPNSNESRMTLAEIEQLCDHGYDPACELIQELIQKDVEAPQTEPASDQPSLTRHGTE